MDCCREAPRLDSLPQNRPSLWLESLLRPDQRLGASAYEAIAVTSAVLRSARSSAGSGDLQQVPYNPQVGQTKLAQPLNSGQIQCGQASLTEQA